VVIGTTSDRAQELLLELHKTIDGKKVLCNLETAELIKYASNSLLSTKISFANAIALLSEKVGADAERVLEAVGLDNRLGRSFLYAGVGYGGSCFPKDVKALIAISQNFGYDFKLLKAVDEINKQVAENFVAKILKHFDGSLARKTMAVLGRSCKPNTDALREAPSRTSIGALIKHGAKIVAYDPVAMENAKTVLPAAVVYAKDAYDAARGADAVAVVTEWNEFRQLDLVKLAKELKSSVVFDGRNIYDPVQIKQLGYIYYGVGRM
jgi:UDPglucose 6-dehydrogenase